MQLEKTVGLSFRITPRMKRMLEAAAARERRSLTNMIEILVDDYCQLHGISEHDVAVLENDVAIEKKTYERND